MNEVPTTPTATDRQAEVIRLNGVIAEGTRKLDELNEATRIALIANQDAMANNEKFKAEEAELQRDHETAVKARKGTLDALDAEIADATAENAKLEAESQTTTKKLAKTNADIADGEKNVADLKEQAHVLAEGNHPLILAAEARLTEVREQTTQEQSRFDNFVIQRGAFQKDMDKRHAIVMAEEKRMEEERKKFDGIKRGIRTDFPDQHVAL